MYTKRGYSIKNMVVWTRQETILLTVIALIPVVVYESTTLRPERRHGQIRTGV
jgi:hypothetical protein